MSKADKPKGKVVVPLGGGEHGMTVAVLDEPDESGRGRAQIGRVVPMRDGEALPPGASVVSTSVDEEGLMRMEEEFTVPGGSEKPSTSASVGWGRKYADTYDQIDWGHSRETDPALN